MVADEPGADRRRERHSVPVQTSATRNNVEPLRRHPASTTDTPRGPARSSKDTPGGPGRSSTMAQDGAVEQARPRRLRVTARQSDQCVFELDNGPRGTSTPSPTFDRREALQTAAPAVASPAAPPHPSPKPAAGSQSRPVFEPVVAAEPCGDDRLPVVLPVAAAPTLNSRKPDVIRDVNDDVAEPLRAAPRTERHRRRASEAAGGRGEAAEQPQQQQVRDDSSPDDDDDDESSGSDDSGEFLLRQRRSEDEVVDRQTVTARHIIAQSAPDNRRQVRFILSQLLAVVN